MKLEIINKILDNIGRKIRCISANRKGVFFENKNRVFISRYTFFYLKDGEIKIGTNFSTNINTHITACAGGRLTIGNNVSFNRNDIIICRDAITIGNHVAFGPNVVVYDHDHVFNEEGFENNTYKTSPIIIGDNCWIGANVTLLRGTIIGEGSVIGAGTVLKGQVPPHSVVKSTRDYCVQLIRSGSDKNHE